MHCERKQVMRNTAPLLLLALLLMGCASPGQPEASPTKPAASASLAPTSTPAPTPTPCSGQRAWFGDANVPQEMILSYSYNVSVPVYVEGGLCPGYADATELEITFSEGKKVLGKALLSQLSAENYAVLEWRADVDNTHEITASLSPPFSNEKKKITVLPKPLGIYSAGGGLEEGEPVHLDYGSRIAAAFEVGSETKIASVTLDMRRLRERPSSEFAVQIRPDAGGRPSGSIEAEARRGLIILPAELGKVRLGFPAGSSLRAGRYWLVVYPLSTEPMEVRAYLSSEGSKARGMRSLNSALSGENWEPTGRVPYFSVSGLAG
ncbi:MAG: choice-of-anchor R domain-containing protein [Candidatus Micrarchaeota archaeon]